MVANKSTGQLLGEKIKVLIKESGFRIESYEINYSETTIWIRNLEACHETESEQEAVDIRDHSSGDRHS